MLSHVPNELKEGNKIKDKYLNFHMLGGGINAIRKKIFQEYEVTLKIKNKKEKKLTNRKK